MNCGRLVSLFTKVFDSGMQMLDLRSEDEISLEYHVNHLKFPLRSRKSMTNTISSNFINFSSSHRFSSIVFNIRNTTDFNANLYKPQFYHQFHQTRFHQISSTFHQLKDQTSLRNHVRNVPGAFKQHSTCYSPSSPCCV